MRLGVALKRPTAYADACFHCAGELLELKRQLGTPLVPSRDVTDPPRTGPSAHEYAGDSRIGVLVMACNRVQVRRTLDQIFKLRPADNFPVVLSQDCGHEATAHVIDTYEDRLIHIHVRVCALSAVV